MEKVSLSVINKVFLVVVQEKNQISCKKKKVYLRKSLFIWEKLRLSEKTWVYQRKTEFNALLDIWLAIGVCLRQPHEPENRGTRLRPYFLPQRWRRCHCRWASERHCRTPDSPRNPGTWTRSKDRTWRRWSTRPLNGSDIKDLCNGLFVSLFVCFHILII